MSGECDQCGKALTYGGNTERVCECKWKANDKFEATMRAYGSLPAHPPTESEIKLYLNEVLARHGMSKGYIFALEEVWRQAYWEGYQLYGKKLDDGTK